ncbi:MAG: Holliday junction resolvase RuvX [Myxococcales bacterium FL481]|nr:MAG: Holliday junction resolvase RuvX [Myxococcales bacterium FL481]
MRALALDVGSKTIGLALSDAESRFASALEVLSRQGQAADARAVAALVARHDVDRIVVGLPLELDGRRGHRVRRVERFVDALVTVVDVPVVWWDERFSTAAAERTLLEADVSRAKRKQRIDALAAQFILQGWLDAQATATEAADE